MRVEPKDEEKRTTETMLSFEEKLKSPADEFFIYFTRKIHHVSVHYPAEELRFYIQSTDLEKRTVTMRIFGKKVNPKYFETVKVTMVFPTEDIHSPVNLQIVCKYKRHDPKDQITRLFYNTLARHIKLIDTNLYDLNHTNNSIVSEYPAEECFKAFIEACEESEDDDAVVEIQTKDLVKRTTTIGLMRSTDVLMTKFNRLKVTITITPQEGDKCCHVEWTTEAEELSDNRRDKTFFPRTAKLIHGIIRKKLQRK
ncbi:hypothetical protein BRARA_I03198 [Brassica rapa]|uniref:Bet v I/Major latex protein domain-containing protein n=1 Tax=Brassica campestris TaxID=3711 RepID=A0A397Y025_BRACM|nr:hypothetical protein BRARA_I03198 [Brassica rapa]